MKVGISVRFILLLLPQMLLDNGWARLQHRDMPGRTHTGGQWWYERREHRLQTGALSWQGGDARELTAATSSRPPRIVSGHAWFARAGPFARERVRAAP